MTTTPGTTAPDTTGPDSTAPDSTGLDSTGLDSTGLRAEQLVVDYGGDPVIDGLDLRIDPGRITAVVGANGSGKSTLLRALGRLTAPRGGRVLLDGHDIASGPARALARRLSVLPQSPRAPEGLRVVDLVSRGRDPHRRWFEQWSSADEEVVGAVLERVGLAELAHTRLDDLSGGQRQRAWIGMALAQGADTLLLDEPTTFLDIAHQLDVLDLLVEMNRDRGVSVAMVLHDLNLASRYADTVVVMRSGRVLAAGAPAEVVTPAVLRAAFSIEARVEADPGTGRPLVVPLSTLRGDRGARRP